ncbi:hypothetical protein POM88_017446 [Heracleum sosnowskyi]|uniref:Uncharacterized protein n=1 Tax=Heracleum sosnowskyi TaxID=360622 RepID=A0AAD8MZC8_9APIA|nr:hypothetical protein POM88_017446 [Heracleum sosnowskyi]
MLIMTQNCAHLVMVWKVDKFFKKMKFNNWKIFGNDTDNLVFGSGKLQMINLDDCLDSLQGAQKDLVKKTRGKPMENDFDIVIFIVEVAPKGVVEPFTRRSRDNSRKDTETTKKRRHCCQEAEEGVLGPVGCWLLGLTDECTLGGYATGYSKFVTKNSKNEDKQSGSFERFTEKNKVVCFIVCFEHNISAYRVGDRRSYYPEDRVNHVDFDKSGNNNNNKRQLHRLKMKELNEMELTKHQENRRAVGGGSMMIFRMCLSMLVNGEIHLEFVDVATADAGNGSKTGPCASGLIGTWSSKFRADQGKEHNMGNKKGKQMKVMKGKLVLKAKKTQVALFLVLWCLLF